MSRGEADTVIDAPKHAFSAWPIHFRQRNNDMRAAYVSGDEGRYIPDGSAAIV
jgi:hypothetical protein